MGIEHYNQPDPVFFILEVCNAFFTTVFGLGNFFLKKIKFKSLIKCLLQHIFFSQRL